MALPNDVLIHILEYLRGDCTYRKRCLHTTKRLRTCKNRPMPQSVLCYKHEKMFQKETNPFEALIQLNLFMIPH